MITFQWSFVLYGRNKLYLFGYLYFSPNTFPKIKQKLDGQLEIRLSVVTYCNYVHTIFRRLDGQAEF